MQPREPRPPFVVASVLARDPRAAGSAADAAAGAATMIELRADHLDAGGVREAVARADRPVIVAVRRVADGGGFDGDERTRRGLLLAALSAGARYIDVEWGSALADLAQGEHAPRVILSDHRARPDAVEIETRYRSMAATRAARLKIVLREATPEGMALVRRLLRRQADPGRRRLTAFCAGSGGEPTRILCCAWGGWGTYGAIRRGAETAEGQLPARDLLETHDVLRLGPQSLRHALVGLGVTNSPSPAMHRAGYAALGLDACYVPLELPRFRDCVPAVQALQLDGLAVTMPHKEAAARISRTADDVVRRAAAANTIRITRGGWQAYNTDGPGALEAVRRYLDPAGRRVALLGAGGTARALAVVFREAGADVRLFNRSAERGAAVAATLGLDNAPLSDLPRSRWDVLVNATPAGGAGERLLDAGDLRGRLVLDVVYGSRPTPLIQDARARGLHTIDGLEMLARQAVLQFHRLTGRPISFDLLHEAGRRWLGAP